MDSKYLERLQGRQILFISPTPVLSSILQAQGIPHIRELSRRYGVKFTLLTFERSDWTNREKDMASKISHNLFSWGIDWCHLSQISFPILPNSTGYLLKAFLPVLKLIRKKNIEIVHCRSYMPAFLMLFIKRLVNVKILFDVRGFYPEEMIRSGTWKRNSLAYWASKRLETHSLKAADAIVVVTRNQYEILIKSYKNSDWVGCLLKKLYLIRNCADINRFKRNSNQRLEIRKKLFIEHNIVFVWLVGHIRNIHMPLETVNFFKFVSSKLYANAKLLVLTNSPDANNIINSYGLKPEEYIIKNVGSAEVPLYLQAGDIALGFVAPYHEDIGIKFAEYLAAGLPVVVNKRNCEQDILVRNEKLGVVVDEFNESSYKKAMESLCFIMDSPDAASFRCEEVAKQYYALDSAVEKYASIYANLL